MFLNSLLTGGLTLTIFRKGADFMDRFKGKVGGLQAYTITEQNFFEVTGNEPPYCVKGANGERRLYAVCPLCDNPIQIIGLYKDTPEAGRKPYGRHNKGTIPHLAQYDEGEYLDCPYANPNRKTLSKYRRPESKIGRQIYDLLREQFDRVIYLLKKDTGIFISEATAAYMLKEYLGDRGYLYRVATLYNLPWSFAFGTLPKKLYGRKIIQGSELHKALHEHCPDVIFIGESKDEYVQVKPRGKRNLGLYYAFYNFRQHQGSDTDDSENIVETVDFVVYRSQGVRKILTEIYKKTITINPDYFMNLVCLAEEKAYRNETLLNLANLRMQGFKTE